MILLLQKRAPPSLSSSTKDGSDGQTLIMAHLHFSWEAKLYSSVKCCERTSLQCQLRNNPQHMCFVNKEVHCSPNHLLPKLSTNNVTYTKTHSSIHLLIMSHTQKHCFTHLLRSHTQKLTQFHTPSLHSLQPPSF